MRVQQALLMASVIALAIAGCKNAEQKTPAATEADQQAQPVREVAMPTQSFEYGFRYDPVEVMSSDTSLDGALVRTLLLKTPRPGDAATIEAHFAEVFATQKPDGSFEDEHDRPPADATGAKVYELLQKGCSPDRPDMQLAIAFLEKTLAELPEDERSKAPGDAVYVMCLLGKTDSPAIKATLESQALEMPELWGKGCPGTPFAQLQTIWAGRKVADVTDAIEATLGWADEAVAPPACSSKLGLMSSWTMFEVLGAMDHPAAARLARRLAPLLVRAQQADGHWREGHGGDKTFYVLRFLMNHGLLEELRGLPPMPADWKIVRALPTPGTRVQNICALNGRLWALDMSGPAIVEISPEDGRVLDRLTVEPIPGLHHMTLAAGEGVFYVSSFGHKDGPTDAVHEIDAVTGKSIRHFSLERTSDITGATRVGRQILASDGWGGGVWVIDLDNADATPQHTYEAVAAGMPDYLASDGETIWGVDFMAPSLVHSTSDGKLLDWGERPFGFQPVAWDGEHLWALGPDNKRICLIERASTDEAPSVEVTGQFVQAEPAFDIPRASDTPDFGPDAADQQTFAVDLLSPVFQPQGKDDFDARFTLAWSDQGLLVGAHVRDDNFVSAEDLKNLWGNQADCVLLYVKPAKGPMLRVVVEPGMTADQPEPRVMRRPGQSDSDIIAQRSKLDDGYSLDLLVPWDLIGVDVSEGEELRVQLIALDVDGRGEDQEMHGLMWYPATGTPENPSISYRVRLATKASPAVAGMATPVKNAHGLIDSIRVTARADRAGKIAAIGTAQRAMALDSTGMAVAWSPLPATKAWPMTVTLDGETVATFDPAAAAANGRVIIEGVPSLGWGASGDTTFAGATEAALSVTDHPYSYAQIMGYSGLAFRFRWAPSDEGWCPSVPVGEFPEERDAVSWATGWQFNDIDIMEHEGDPQMQRFAGQMVASIDAGFPIIGYGPDLNVAVAFGYENDGESFLWYHFFGGDEPVVIPATKTGPWIWILQEFTDPPSRQEQLLAALKIAVRNWHRQPDRDREPNNYLYLWGEIAFTAWAADIRNAMTFDQQQRAALFFENWWCFQILVDARNSAAVFLREYADAAENDQAAEHLRKAADLYEQEGRLLGAFYGTKDGFIGPWSGKGIDDWSDDMRQREVEAITAAHDLDRQAIAELEAVLTAMGVEAAEPAAP